MQTPPELRSAQVCGALINHDTWHRSSTDTWHSSPTFLGMSFAYFRVTHVAPSSTTCQHSDVRPPHQLREIILWEVFLFKMSAISKHGLKDVIVGRRISFSGGAKIAGGPRSLIEIRSTTTLHFGITTCSGVKILKKDKI
jgi:hypothetical protein